MELRWDVNPAPGVRSGPKPLVLVDSSVTQDKPLYSTRWFDIAPRIGLAYQMDTTENREMMFRAGFGLFYDVGYGITAGAFNGAPYSNDRTISLATFPLSSSDAAPPVMPPEPPYGQITGSNVRPEVARRLPMEHGHRTVLWKGADAQHRLHREPKAAGCCAPSRSLPSAIPTKWPRLPPMARRRIITACRCSFDGD